MTTKQILDEMQEVCELNREARRRSNDLFSKLRGHLEKKSSDDYEKGLNDAWTVMARIIRNDTVDNNIPYNDVIELFPKISDYWGDIIYEYSPREVLNIVAEYDKKKAEVKVEKKVNSEPVMGDVVEVRNKSIDFVGIGIYLCKSKYDYSIIFDDCDVPQEISIDRFSIKKTGKHVDLKGMAVSLKEE